MDNFLGIFDAAFPAITARARAREESSPSSARRHPPRAVIDALLMH